MACIGAISSVQTIPCGTPNAALLGRPVSAKVLSARDVASYTITGSPAVANITRNAGSAGAVSVETANNSLVVTMAVRGGEIYPQMADPTITMTFFGGDFVSNSLGSTNSLGLNNEVIVAVDHGNGVIRVYGLGNPLSCLSIEGSSDGNGYLKATFGLEDWQTGTTVYRMSTAGYGDLSNPVSGGGDAG